MAINWLSYHELPDGLHKKFATMFAHAPSSKLIHNVSTHIETLQVNEHLLFTTTINDAAIENSFVCSPYTAYALYAQDELKAKVPNKLLQYSVLWIIKLLGLLFKIGRIDRNVHVNNFLLSTNPYQEWDGKEIAKITDAILLKYPKHAIIFRSLNLQQHQNLINSFELNGYHKVGSRQVYIYEMPYESWLKHNNNKNDLRLIKKQKLRYLSHQEMGSYLDEALALYNLLYLQKYSKYNPQFNINYFQACHRNNLMHFQGYADDQGKLRAFSGLFILDQTITSPLVGYDTKAPQKDGLYIHAINLIFKYKFESGKILNLSSGASQFKRLRGGVPYVEYSVIYLRHLPSYRKLVWYFLIFVSNKIGIPLTQKYEL